jgi:hypothetical protein
MPSKPNIEFRHKLTTGTVSEAATVINDVLDRFNRITKHVPGTVVNCYHTRGEIRLRLACNNVQGKRLRAADGRYQPLPPQTCYTVVSDMGDPTVDPTPDPLPVCCTTPQPEAPAVVEAPTPEPTTAKATTTPPETTPQHELNDLTRPELIAQARKLNLSPAGSRQDLIDRIKAAGKDNHQ